MPWTVAGWEGHKGMRLMLHLDKAEGPLTTIITQVVITQIVITREHVAY